MTIDGSRGYSTDNISSLADRVSQQLSTPIALQKMSRVSSPPQSDLIHLKRLTKNYVSQARGSDTSQAAAQPLQLATTDLKILGEEFHRLNKENPSSQETQAARAAFLKAKATASDGNSKTQPQTTNHPDNSNTATTPQPVNKNIAVVVSFDDLNKDPNEIYQVLTKYHKYNIPVEFYPINNNDPRFKKQMENVHKNLVQRHSSIDG